MNHSLGDSESPSQIIEEFEELSQEGFDDDMAIDDFPDNDDADIEEPMPAMESSETKEEAVDEEEKPKPDNRGFSVQQPVSLKAEVGGWQSGSAKQTAAAPEISIDTSTLPLTRVEMVKDPETEEKTSEDVLKMYWIDAHEDPMKHPGVVWLFGKVFFLESF